MAQSLKDTTSVFVLPAQHSEQTAEMFIRDLEKHITNSTSKKIIIEYPNIMQLLPTQITLLDRIAELCKKANIQLIHQSGQTGMKDNTIEQCTDNFGVPSSTNELSDPLADATGQISYSVNEYNDEFHPTNSEFHTAVIELNDYFVALEFDSKTHYIIKTIFYEVVGNIMLHSRMNPEDQISFNMITSEKDIKMTFIDSGMRFDLSKQPNGPIESSVHEEDRLSFGIYLICTLSDRIEYQRSKESKNITTIICRRNKK
jgi:anti-sigma regulatory factor (Ser/Thr protein kinase)